MLEELQDGGRTGLFTLLFSFSKAFPLHFPLFLKVHNVSLSGFPLCCTVSECLFSCGWVDVSGLHSALLNLHSAFWVLLMVLSHR